MEFFFFVFLCCALFVGYGIVQKVLDRKDRTGGAEEIDSLLEQIDSLAERISVLEEIVTDDRHKLTREFADLERQ